MYSTSLQENGATTDRDRARLVWVQLFLRWVDNRIKNMLGQKKNYHGTCTFFRTENKCSLEPLGPGIGKVRRSGFGSRCVVFLFVSFHVILIFPLKKRSAKKSVLRLAAALFFHTIKKKHKNSHNHAQPTDAYAQLFKRFNSIQYMSG